MGGDDKLWIHFAWPNRATWCIGGNSWSRAGTNSRVQGYLYSSFCTCTGIGKRGCCSSEPCSWQNCAWCCCRRGPRAEKNQAGEMCEKFCSVSSQTGFLQSHHTALLLSFAAAEICRLRWNWFYLIILACLSVIGYSSPLPSFHQFVTNPTAQQLNGTGREHEVLCPSNFQQCLLEMRK